MKQLIGFLLILLLGATTVEGKKRFSQKEFNNMEQLIKSNRFQIDITRVIPSRGMDVTRFNISGKITINDSLYVGYLPFFGRAYRLTPGSDAGIEFDGKPLKYSYKVVESRRKTVINYEFSIAGKEDTFRFFIEISPKGSCSISLNSNNRESISYIGEVIPLPTIKEE